MYTGRARISFVIAKRAELEKCEGRARSVSLDLYDQWKVMEQGHGKWRFTSPTHVVRAFIEALMELQEEGGVAARHKRYAENQRRLAEGMDALGFRPLLSKEVQSPIITSFLYPDKNFDFKDFYEFMKREATSSTRAKSPKPTPSASATSATST